MAPKHRKNKKITVLAINKYKEGKSTNHWIDEISKHIPKVLIDDAEIQELLKPFPDEYNF